MLPHLRPSPDRSCAGLCLGLLVESALGLSHTVLSINLIASPALFVYCGTVIAFVTAHGAALLLLLPIIAEDLVVLGSRTAATAHFRKVKSETAETDLMKASPSEAGMQDPLCSRSGVAEVL